MSEALGIVLTLIVSSVFAVCWILWVVCGLNTAIPLGEKADPELKRLFQIEARIAAGARFVVHFLGLLGYVALLYWICTRAK